VKGWNDQVPAYPAGAVGIDTKGLYPALAFVLDGVRREVGYQKLFEEKEIHQDELLSLVEKVSKRLGLELSSLERDEVLIHLERDQKPFGILQELVDDCAVTDIIITNCSKIGIQRDRKNYLTRLSFPNQGFYEAFVEKLLHRAGTSYSTKQPIADGMIDSFARVHAVHKSLCESGPYLTVRLNRFSSVGVADLIKARMAPRPIFDYLSAIIEAGQTVLVAGEVGTGKTTLVRALAAEMPPEESILVIEDTPEIRLEHPHVRYMTTREENLEGAGRIPPSECIRAGMRMAMNRIIFGEIRDAEAAEAFVDVCASGHPGLSTLHARSSSDAMGRLELFLGRAQPGVGKGVLSEQLATAVQVIVHVFVCKETGKRRISEVREIGPVADGVVRQRLMFKYDSRNGGAIWKVSHRISAHRDLIEGAISLSSLPVELREEV
jgi:pilus assembly protein CpaF